MVITHLRSRPEFCGPYTVDDLDTLLLRQIEGLRIELAHGWLLVSRAPSSPSFAHQQVCLRLAARLGAVGERTGLFTVHGPGTIVLPSGLEFVPDVLVTSGRQPLSTDWRSISTRLLAVEVLSRWSRETDLGFKRKSYLEIGIPEVWLVDPTKRTVRIAKYNVRDDVTLEPPAVIEWRDIAIDLTALFSDD